MLSVPSCPCIVRVYSKIIKRDTELLVEQVGPDRYGCHISSYICNEYINAVVSFVEEQLTMLLTHTGFTASHTHLDSPAE